MKPATLAIAMAFVTTPALAYLSLIASKPCIAQWPPASIRNAESGTVDQLIHVGVTGYALDAKVATSSGFANLDKATIRTAASCRFRPATENGAVVAAWFKLKHEWKAGAPSVVLAQPTAKCARPEWPNTSIRFGEAPTVLLAFLVDEHGKVVDSRIEKSWRQGL